MDNFTYGRKQKKIQWRANLPIVLTVVAVLGLVYGVVNLIVSQIKPEAKPISTITITKNTPSASELSLSAPLVDYNPNKEECQEEKLDSEETDEERDKRLEECKKKKEEEKKEEEKDESEVASGETVEVLGEQVQRTQFMEMFAKMLGASAAKSNNAKNSTGAEEKKAEDLVGGGADSGENKVDDSVREYANN